MGAAALWCALVGRAVDWLEGGGGVGFIMVFKINFSFFLILINLIE